MGNKRKPIILDTQEKRDIRTRQLINSAFDDYTSSRFLLINNYPVNGLILASMAIEKYLKAILVHITGEVKTIHFDNIAEIQADFQNTDFKVIFEVIDPRYIELLSCAYKIRYYDNLKEPMTVFFVTNQVLAETDLFVANLEELLKFETEYKRRRVAQDVRICEQNYLAYHWGKKDFCERECYSHFIYIDPSDPDPARGSTVKKLSVPYRGRLESLRVSFEKISSNQSPEPTP